MRILKYRLPITAAAAVSLAQGENPAGWAIDLDLPVGSRLMSVQLQFEDARLWAAVDQSAPTEKRRIGLFHTGAELPVDAFVHGGFLGTIQYGGGGYVVHAFDLGQTPADTVTIDEALAASATD